MAASNGKVKMEYLHILNQFNQTKKQLIITSYAFNV